MKVVKSERRSRQSREAFCSRRWSLACVALALAFLAACGSKSQQTPSESTDEQAVSSVEEAPKNVILMIGDGMGAAQVGFLELFAKHSPNSTFESGQTAFDHLAESGEVSMSMTNPAEHMVVDSACSASQLATGKPGRLETVGLDTDGNPAQTVVEFAESRGKSTGLVSDTRITHATPAGFVAHVAHRSMETEIAEQIVASDVDVLLSAGLRYFIPQGMSAAEGDDRIPYPYQSRRSDDRNLLDEAESNGFATVFDREGLASTSADRLLGLFANSAMMGGITDHQTRGDQTRTEPTLAEMTRKALDTLSRDEDGFFLMVEGGQIDWAGHNNDAGRLLHELIRFEEAVEVVRQWAAERSDTLVVVTADHETGGFGFAYSKENLNDPMPLPGTAFEGVDYQPNFNFGSFEHLATLYNQQKSFFNILMEWARGGEQTPERLRELVVDATGLELSLEEARQIATNAENEWYVEGHPYLSAAETPAICDFASFYVYGEGDRAAAIARALADQVNVTWGNGTHTHAPVPVFIEGPASYEAAFDRLLHHTDIGQLLFDAVGSR